MADAARRQPACMSHMWDLGLHVPVPIPPGRVPLLRTLHRTRLVLGVQGLHTATMVHVPRDETLGDALGELSADQQEQIRNRERKLVEYLATRDLGAAQAGR